MNNPLKYSGLISATATLLIGCGGDNNPTDTGINRDTDLAIIQTVAADYSGSSVQVVDLLESDLVTTDEYLALDLSDYDIATHQGSLYHIGRYNIDELTQADIDKDLSETYTYSLLDDPEDNSANVYRMVFISDSKAYLIRYGQPNIWIVNPSATTENDFKLGELDLSEYLDQDTSVEASDGIIVDGKLFVAMQRIDSTTGNPLTNSAYVAVFDTATDTEIDTDLTDDPNNLYGIELSIHNTNNFAYHEDAGLLLGGAGDPWGAAYYGRDPGFEGGIVQIDTVSYVETMLVDDGDDIDHPYGYFQKIAIIDEENGFFVGLAAYQDTSLFHFNPSTGDVTAVSGIENIEIGALTASPSDNVWVGVYDAADPRILVVNTDLETEAEIKTAQNPKTIIFTD